MLKDNILDSLIIRSSKIVHKKFHIARTLEAFHFLNSGFNLQEAVKNSYDEIEKVHAGLNQDECLRVIFSASHPPHYEVTVRKLETLNSPIRLNAVVLPGDTTPGMAFKWADRKFWEVMIKNNISGADDIVGIRGNVVVETSRFNIFCYDESSRLFYTPLLSSGCMNGVLRRFFLSEGFLDAPSIGRTGIKEKEIFFEEFKNYKIFVGNSIRGLLEATINKEEY